MSTVSPPARRPLVRGPRRWLLLLAGVAALSALPFVVTVEPPAPAEGWHVNVRWAPGVSAQARGEMESRYRLRPLQPHAERTWIYRIGDTSRANIRALVTDPRVEDTHGIDRQAFTLTAPRVTVARRIADVYPREIDRIRNAVSWRNTLVAFAAVLVVLALRSNRIVAVLAR